ncbi:MAG: allantoinase AllB [Deltaproteobacteria bacterium]|nr:MAG: allantoinase AllB [Deltaproteobacteria bacterium]
MKCITSNRVLSAGSLAKRWIVFDDEKIRRVIDVPPTDFEGEMIDCGNMVVAPGLVDTHVHINEPGRTEWEGFETATMSAAAGGITTVMDMPLNCLPVTTSKFAMDEKLNALQGKLHIDVGLWGGVTPYSLKDLDFLLQQGVFGVKSFLIDSGIEEFPEMNEKDLDQAMSIIANYDVPYLIHAEIDDHKTSAEITEKYQSFVDSRPRSWENEAIKLMIDKSKQHNCRVHIVHLSSADMLPEIKKAKAGGKFTVETCPHYLLLNAEEIPDGKTQFKCCPPIREKENNEKLWQAIQDETIDFVVSDHSPCTPSLKLMETGDLEKAWGGISSLQFGLPLMWTEFRSRGMDIPKLFKMMSEKTSSFLGLQNRKGKLDVGMDADFVVFDPDEEFEITKDVIYHKHKITPYEGRKVFGKVHMTFLRGEKVFDNNKFLDKPFGKTLIKGK